MALVQVTERRGRVDQVPIGERPQLVELHLDDNQQIVDWQWIALPSPRRRKTEDWIWIAWVATRL